MKRLLIILEDGNGNFEMVASMDFQIAFGAMAMEFCNRGYGNGNLEMEFCNGVAMENLKWNSVIGAMAMEFCNGVAMENLKWNSVIGAIAMEISKWNSVMGWQWKI